MKKLRIRDNLPGKTGPISRGVGIWIHNWVPNSHPNGYAILHLLLWFLFPSDNHSHSSRNHRVIHSLISTIKSLPVRNTQVKQKGLSSLPREKAFPLNLLFSSIHSPRLFLFPTNKEILTPCAMVFRIHSFHSCIVFIPKCHEGRW